MRSIRRDDRIVIGPPPRVALLPPEVAEARTWRTVRRSVAAAGAVVLIVTGITAAHSYVAAQQSADRLSAAQLANQGLLARAQGYSTVTELQSKIATATTAQVGATADWIDWRKVVRRVERALPTGTCIDSFTFTTASASATASATSTAPAGTVVTVALGGMTDQVSDVQTWISGLSTVPGFLDADPGSVQKDAVTGSLNVAVSMYLGPKVYASRADALVAVPVASTPIPLTAGCAATVAPVTNPTTATTPTPIEPAATPTPAVTATAPATASISEASG